MAHEVETPHGPARIQPRPAESPVGVLALGHGAGGGVDAPDLVAATEAALAQGFSVVLVDQPYRVAGRRSPAPARQLDAAWLAVMEHLRARQPGLPLVTGGRSAGARVACRTAAEAQAAAVLCLAFPVHPPGKADDPSKSRMAELNAVEVPTLVVQGRSDPFGMPTDGPNRQVVQLAGNHGLKSDLDGVARAVGDFLAGPATA